MSKSNHEKVRVRRRLWRDRRTGETTDLIIIGIYDYFVKVPFDQARRVVDEVHDACDERDRELREQP
ncbi:hypothetical protein [Leucobacter sp. W1038]|uniref:hypothetical protein n=1 Tax=Leucobacter sp. W1038 TaxID=3438281 RepID=UPI003D98BAFD